VFKVGTAEEIAAGQTERREALPVIAMTPMPKKKTEDAAAGMLMMNGYERPRLRLW
jgi:hypothetical protein